MSDNLKKYAIGGGILSGVALFGLYVYNKKKVRVDQSIK
jgi:hypothetical protein